MTKKRKILRDYYYMKKIDIQQLVEGELELRRFQLVNERKTKKMQENLFN